MAAGGAAGGQPPTQRPLAAIAARLAAAAALALMFALVKLAASRGAHVVETLFYRQAFALPLLLIWAQATGGAVNALRTARPASHAIRAAIGLVAMALNFMGMILLPLTQATVIGFTVPLFATMLAALLLGEATGRYRWGAILLGFVGVMIVLRPDGGQLATTGAAVAIAGAVMTASVTVYIRQLGGTEGATTIVLWFTLLSLLPLGAMMLVFGRAHDPQTWGILLLIGVAGGIGQLCLTLALRLAPVAVVLPMDYTSLLWATALGYLLFGTLPAPATLLGAPIIIASGLIILWREHALSRRSAEAMLPAP